MGSPGRLNLAAELGIPPIPAGRAPGSGAPGSEAPGGGAPGSGAQGFGAPGSWAPGGGTPSSGAHGGGATDSVSAEAIPGLAAFFLADIRDIFSAQQ